MGLFKKDDYKVFDRPNIVEVHEPCRDCGHSRSHHDGGGPRAKDCSWPPCSCKQFKPLV